MPVLDPPAKRKAVPDLPYLPPPPGPQGKIPRLAMRKQVPTGLPLVVQPQVGRWILLYLVPLVLLLVPTIVLFATGNWQPALFVLTGSVGLYVVTLGFRLFSQVRGGPFLAADRDGVWLRVQKWPVKAIQIPWELIAEIHTKRWFVDKVLCVVPRDDRIGKLPRLWGSIDQARTSAFFGSALTASVGFGDVPPDAVTRQLDELAQGRSRIVR